MSQETFIEWCDSTINPTSGCDGCELWNKAVKICYAGHIHENRLARSFPTKYAKSFSEVREIPGRIEQAANWSDLRGKPRPKKPWLNGLPRQIFVGDMGDIFSDGISYDYLLKELYAHMISPKGQRHFWIILTKRPRRLREFSEKVTFLPDNCMAMTTATDQCTFNLRAPELLKVRAVWKGISAEPLFGPIDFSLALPWTAEFESGKVSNPTLKAQILQKVSIAGVDVVILGGASGKNAPPCNLDWIRAGVKQVRDSGASVFVKQLGSNVTVPHPTPRTSQQFGGNDNEDWHLKLRDPDGADSNEWPNDIRVREWPRVIKNDSPLLPA